MENIRRGYERVSPLVGSLAVPETTEAWDGQDAAVEAADEFSLDDIMNEEL